MMVNNFFTLFQFTDIIDKICHGLIGGLLQINPVIMDIIPDFILEFRVEIPGKTPVGTELVRFSVDQHKHGLNRPGKGIK